MQDSRTHVGNEAKRRRERSESIAGTVDLPLMGCSSPAANRDRTPIEAEEAGELAAKEHVGEGELVSLAPGSRYLIGDPRKSGAPYVFTRALAEPW